MNKKRDCIFFTILFVLILLLVYPLVKPDRDITKPIENESIDNTGPTAVCRGEIGSTKTSFFITANDESGILKYVYNGNEYNTSHFSINNSIFNASVLVYDNYNNVTEVSCNMKRVFENTMSLSKIPTEYITCQNASFWFDSNTELDRLINDIGYKTREAVAAAGKWLSEFKYKIPYSWDGKYYGKGINPDWGCDKWVPNNSSGRQVCTHAKGNEICEKGLDCTGFTTWAFIQAGFDRDTISSWHVTESMWGNFNAYKHTYKFSDSNLSFANQIKPGDIVAREGHVGLVIGTDDEKIMITSMLGPIIIQYIKKSNGLTVKDMEGENQLGFTHFILMDDYYSMYGS